MKYLIVSDIHGSLPALETILQCYEQERCDMLLLLGDLLNYGPRNSIPIGIDPQGIAQRLNAMSSDIIAVRGNCDSEVDQMLLHFPMLSDYACLIDNGRRILLTHGHVYNEQQLPTWRFDVMFCGHSHLQHISPRPDGSVLVNTGSPTFPKGGNPPTFAILDGDTISIRLLSGDILHSYTLSSHLSSPLS